MGEFMYIYKLRFSGPALRRAGGAYSEVPAEIIKCGPAGSPPAETYMIFVFPLTVDTHTRARVCI
jgi:hypothetical protein